MLKRLAATAATALAVIVGTVGLGAPAANAAGTCTLTVPARLSIWHQTQTLTTRAAGECTVGTGWGEWDLIHPTLGPIATTAFDAPATTDVFDVPADSPLGKMTWLPWSAEASDGTVLTQNTTYTEIRVGSWATTSATRSGGIVTISTRAMRYATSLDKAIPWAGAVGQIQYRVPGTTTWHPLKAVSTASNGTYTYRYTMSQVRDYRTVYVGTPYIWNYTSLTVNK